MSFSITVGFADEITLSNGKKIYTGVASIKTHTAKEKGLLVKTVRFKGCCIYANINQRAKDQSYFPIEIDGIDIYSYIDLVADENDPII